MYVCLCNAVTDRCVRAAIDDGANSLSQVFKILGSAPQCGKCTNGIRALLDEAAASAPPLTGLQRVTSPAP